MRKSIPAACVTSTNNGGFAAAVLAPGFGAAVCAAPRKSQLPFSAISRTAAATVTCTFLMICFQQFTFDRVPWPPLPPLAALSSVPRSVPVRFVLLWSCPVFRGRAPTDSAGSDPSGSVPPPSAKKPQPVRPAPRAPAPCQGCTRRPDSARPVPSHPANLSPPPHTFRSPAATVPTRIPPQDSPLTDATPPCIRRWLRRCAQG